MVLSLTVGWAFSTIIVMPDVPSPIPQAIPTQSPADVIVAPAPQTGTMVAAQTTPLPADIPAPLMSFSSGISQEAMLDALLADHTLSQLDYNHVKVKSATEGKSIED